MNKGLTVTLVYFDGEPERQVKAEYGNTAVVYRILKDSYSDIDLDTEKQLTQAGLYLLVNTKAQTVYIGQGDTHGSGTGVLARMLGKHTDGVDNWDTGYVFCHTNPAFIAPSELCYLENALYNTAVKAGGYSVINKVTPKSATLPTGKKFQCDQFKNECLFVLETYLSCDIFVQKKSAPKMLSMSNHGAFAGIKIYLSYTTKGVDAEGVIGLDGRSVTVKKGSAISTTNNLPNTKVQPALIALRDKLTTDGTIKNGVFTRDHVFASTSQAATIILGSSASGPERWKNKDGHTLKQLGYGK